MKIKRYKKVNKHLAFYRNTFGFRKPYQILLDATFCQMALKYKVNIKEQLPKYLADETKLFTTVCVVNETEKLGAAVYGAMVILKQFNVRKCGHEKNPIDASQCLHSMVQNNNCDHYFIATQDPELSQQIRDLSCVPLLYIKCNAINLEKPSKSFKSTEKTNLNSEQDDDYHMKVVKQLKEAELGVESTNVKKKKRKGANPLSRKPKKKETLNALTTESVIDKKSRKRNRVKVAKHVRQLLQTSGVAI
ncbi:rRNA-processing protein UTP23-like protein [Leptotrombidium deliense]|uniref:rRNA-processing protein UTP23 homolog n=1 Tax=Leptotrombidium deliense TaxID=299467 RepID=A0A443S1Z4_9ACAR|nr:rRNA-processing protein UTP23-like protein [Leptotrombidium deliense]